MMQFRIVLGLSLALVATAGSEVLARKPASKDLAAAKAHFKQGKAYYEAGAWLDAVKEYEKAYALAPLPDLLFNIAQSYRMQGDKPKAMAAYERFLAVVTAGDLADEARAQLAALKLKVQVEEAEAAKRKAEEELAAAHRRAAELEAARKRAEAEAAKRDQAQREDLGRLRRLAVEEAERQQRRAAAARREYEKRLVRAEKQGRGLRGAGEAMIVVGAVLTGIGIGAGILSTRKDGELKDWDHPEYSSERWSSDWDGKLASQKLFQTLFYAQTISGLVMLATGIVLYRVGVSRRTAAKEAVPQPVTVQPLVGPGTAGLSVGGRF